MNRTIVVTVALLTAVTFAAAAPVVRDLGDSQRAAPRQQPAQKAPERKPPAVQPPADRGTPRGPQDGQRAVPREQPRDRERPEARGHFGPYWPPFYPAPYAPWYYPYGYYPPYGYPFPYANYGSVRLEIDQKDAAVFVDGYYAGIVDDYDGVFQRLNLKVGGHRIEICHAGFETLVFDVNIQIGRTITFHHAMVPILV